MEREFRDFQRDKQSAAKTQLRQLLLETRGITHKSLAAVRDNAAAMQAVHDTLRHDARYPPTRAASASSSTSSSASSSTSSSSEHQPDTRLALPAGVGPAARRRP